MKTANAVCAAIALIGSIASSAQAADLFLRPAGAEGGSSITVGVDETAAIEIVVRLEADEELGFANIFLDVDDDDPIEALDFVPGLAVPPARYTSHEQVLRNRFGPFPYSPGDGISLEDYALILDTGGVEGPGTFVLERIEVFGSAVGAARVAFEFGARPPDLFDSDFNKYPVATQDFPPGLSNFVYVGIGDDRDGEAGPLAVTVEQESPPPPPDDDNENSDDYGSDDPPDQDPGDKNDDHGGTNDNDAPDDGGANESDNDAPQDNDNTPDPDDPPPDDDVPDDGDDNDNGSADNDNTADEDPDNPDDQPGGQDVPGSNDNTGGSSPPRASRPCGFGMLPAMVSLLAALGMTREARRRRSR